MDKGESSVPQVMDKGERSVPQVMDKGESSVPQVFNCFTGLHYGLRVTHVRIEQVHAGDVCWPVTYAKCV